MEHHFTVPVPVDVAWQALLDPERVAPCMPGATLNKVEGNDFTGSVKVKLGPVTLLYKGTGTFTEVDEAARRVVVDASGKDSRGNGTAAASVTATLAEENGTTAVRVDTDLKITGKPAQLGRGLISEVGSKLIGQFASCLAERLAGEDTTAAEQQPAAAASEPEPTATAAESETSAAADTGAGATSQSATSQSATSQSAGTSSAAGASATGQDDEDAMSGSGPNGDRPSRTPSSAGQTERSNWRVTSPGAGANAATSNAATSNAATSNVTTGAGNGAGAVAGGARAGERSDRADAIDLLDTAGTPVLKRIAPAVIGGVVLFVLYRLVRRRRRG